MARQLARLGRAREEDCPDKPPDETGRKYRQRQRAPPGQWRQGRGLVGFIRLRRRGLDGLALGRRKYRQPLQDLDRDDGRHCRATGRGQRRADDRRGIGGAGRGQKKDRGRGDELHRAGIDGEKGAHRIGGGAGMRIQFLQPLHGLEAERRGGIAQPQHVCGDIHHHGAHRRVIRRNLGEEQAQDRPQEARQDLHQPGFLRQPHDAQPKRHRPHQGQREVHHRGFRCVEGPIRELLEMPGGSAHEDGGQDQPEPDVIEHRATTTRLPGTGKE